MRKKITLLFFLASALEANSKYDKVFKQVAKKHRNVPSDLLKAIALVENSRMNPKIKRTNRNGTKDYGLMQINTIIAKEFDTKESSLLRPRKNIQVAAKHLARFTKRGLSWYNIGKYHSKTPSKKILWIRKVKKKLASINPRLSRLIPFNGKTKIKRKVKYRTFNQES